MRDIPRRFLLAACALALAAPAFAQEEPDYAALEEIFPDGLPSLLTPQSFASNYRLPARIQPPDGKLPTRVEYADGPLRWDLGTNVTTRTTAAGVLPPPPDPRVVSGAAGGAGEVKGHVRYADREWEFYGTQRFGVTQGDGTPPALNDTTTFGGSYRFPDWMAGGRVGASLELNSADERRTRIEYRRPLGAAEGFIAAEQAFPSARTDHRPPPTVRAGVNRRF